MRYVKTSYGYLIRLELGEKIFESVKKFIKEKKIHSGIFWAIGALDSGSLSFYDLKNKKYLKYEVDYPVEVVSMTGNIAWMKSDVILHCHGVFSDSKGKTIGGHVNEGIVGPTMEVIIFVGKERVERAFNNGVGLNLLNI